MEQLLIHLESRATECQYEDSQYSTSVNYAWLKLQEYYNLSDESCLYRAALALHPSFRFDWFEDNWHTKPAWIDAAKVAIEGLFHQYVKQYAVERPASQSSQSDQDTNPPVPFWFTTTRRRVPPARRRHASDELALFWAEDQSEPIMNPLLWWQKKAEQYPTLSKMALDLFAIPGMSAECERVFSSAKKVVTDERNSISPPTIEALQVAKHWLKQQPIPQIPAPKKQRVLDAAGNTEAQTAPKPAPAGSDEPVDVDA
jgi:hypothetical protein